MISNMAGITPGKPGWATYPMPGVKAILVDDKGNEKLKVKYLNKYGSGGAKIEDKPSFLAALTAKAKAMPKLAASAPRKAAAPQVKAAPKPAPKDPFAEAESTPY